MTGTFARLTHFTRVMYKPHYLLYGVLWVFALEATLALLAAPETPWRPSWSTGLRVLIVAIVLLYLRMVDEQKDLAYDRVHNPDRPLVTGAVTATDLRIGMAVIAVLAVAGSLLLSAGSALAIAAVLLYGLGLWGLERVSAWVRDDILVNLVVTYPVQLLVTAYVLVSVLDTEGLNAGFWRLAPAALIFAGAFLQFEFARKTAHEPRPGEHYYSNVLGARGSTAVSLLFVALAVGAELALVRPWEFGGARFAVGSLVLPLALLPASGALRFLRGAEFPLGPPVLFILGLYAVLIAQSAVGA
ncbi:hypothetical protein [Nocardia asteroides]|uniref:hypothetical protein n=1 Tax=Nocardia asteroides TaxID=1824 RepID=UPI001E37DBFA|nr:hypothetical protein [Nocardia asteroides]UGT61221.1 hypothetical protein LTT61_29500 [Nocardia asteroides]